MGAWISSITQTAVLKFLSWAAYSPTAFTKKPLVQQSDVVSNKRLGTTLALIKALQEAGDRKSYWQHCRTVQFTSPISALPSQDSKMPLKVKPNS